MARSAGVLLSITSLPSPYGIGTIGKEARKFADFLKASGQKIWQILPVGPTSYGDSPYQSFSTYAGNPYMIDLDTLCDEGLITKEELDSYDWGDDDGKVDYEKIYNNRFEVLRTAYKNFKMGDQKKFSSFKRKNCKWLKNYALYMAVKKSFDMASWLEWPDEEIKMHEEKAVEHYQRKYKDEVDFWKFVQFKFYEQWESFRAYVNGLGIKILGDMPIYVAMDSADTWANPEIFQLYDDGDPIAVAGCPPDYFSATGQLWGNPLYDWDAMKKDNYSWWVSRIQNMLHLVDIVRIDHFRGFDTYWQIPYGADNAIGGKWVKGPGLDLFNEIEKRLGKLPIIAEDLGTLTPDVEKLRDDCGFPGMKILQFAFNDNPWSDESARNDYLPDNYKTEKCVVYTGTHDNDTTVGVLSSSAEQYRINIASYFGMDKNASVKDISLRLVQAAFQSKAEYCIIPLQDVYCLGSEARMNTPSTTGANWSWRMDSSLLDSAGANMLKSLSAETSRNL